MQTFLPARSLTPLIELSDFLTRIRPSATKYGSEKSISSSRSALIVIVDRMRSAVPSLRKAMRLSDSASMYFGVAPISSAIAFAMSMSKPATSPVFGSLRPKGGTSNFTPIVISPASWSFFIVVPAANVLASAVVAVVAAAPPELSSSSPQPAAVSTPADSISAASHLHLVVCIAAPCRQ